MTAETFDRKLQVSSDADECWRVLTDVELLASWVTIVHDVKEITRLERYSAVLQDRLGPLKLRADLTIDADVVSDGREIHVRASGKDAHVNSQLAVEATMSLKPDAVQTVVRIAGKYQVTGSAASMGGGIIRKKADLILEQFFAHAAETLGAVDGT